MRSKHHGCKKDDKLETEGSSTSRSPQKGWQRIQKRMFRLDYRFVDSEIGRPEREKYGEQHQMNVLGSSLTDCQMPFIGAVARPVQIRPTLIEPGVQLQL